MSPLAVGDEIDFDLGPFLGLYDSPDPVEAKRRLHRRLFDALNMRFPDVQNGGAVVARQGMLGSSAQLGSSINRHGQDAVMHRRLDGTLDRFVFVGGKMYSWDGTDDADAYTEIDTTGVVINGDDPTYAVSYNNEVIVADETNRPWIYTPETGACETIKYNTADDDWSVQGGPTIDAGKVMFIVKSVGASEIDTEDDDDITTEADEDLTTELLASFQNTVVFCEELDVRTGYRQDGFVNAITLIQSSDEILTALNGQEAGLVYFRQKGISLLTGKTTEDFQASATRDAISITSGTNAPKAIVTAHRKIWYLDMDGRVMRITLGAGEPEALWFPTRRVIDDHIGTVDNRESVRLCGRGVYHEGYDLVLFTIWDRQTIYAFDATSGRYQGTWAIGGGYLAGIHVDAMAAMVDANNRSTFLLLGTRTSTYDVTTQGIVWRQKFASDTREWLDQANFDSGVMTALERRLESHWLTSTAANRYRFDHVAAQLGGNSARHAISLEYTTPKAGRSSPLVAQSVATVGAQGEADAVSNVAWSPGKNCQGGAVRFRLSATHSDNVQFVVNSVAVHGTVTEARRAA